MYEDVCLQCGKPLVDGRAYCSDDCESLDATSPSISSTSSTFPSPHFPVSSPSSTAADRDIPALLPSALGGGPLHVYSRYRKMNNTPNSYSRHQISSTNILSSFSDPEHDHEHDEHSAIHHDLGYHDPGEKHPSASISPLHSSTTPSGLSYARKPSSTNHHSTVPLLHRRSSSGASSPTPSIGIPRSAPSPVPLPPYSSTEDDFSDNPEKDSTVRVKQSIAPSLKTSSKKRNRASLPAYFSLLQLSSTTSPSRHKSSASASHSVPKPSSPAPRTRDHAFSITAPSTSAVTPATVLANHVASTPQDRGRGRSRRRGEVSPIPPSRSRPRRNSSHVHVSSLQKSSCQHDRLSQKARRIDSVEKVADWMSTSIGASSKRNPYSGFPDLSGRDEESEDEDIWENEHRAEKRGERRGRRRINELDVAPDVAKGAPGFGSGRSGIRDRERRGIGLGLMSGANLSILEKTR